MATRVSKKIKRKITKPIKKKVKIKKPKVVKQAKKIKSLAKRSTKSIINSSVRKLEHRGVKLTKLAIKRLFSGTSGVDLSKATSPILKQYIKDSVKLINASIPTMNRASKKAVIEAMRILGEGEIKGTLSDVVTGDKKKLLFEKARLLESILSGDGVSSVALIIRNFQTSKAYDTFIKGPTGANMEGLTFEEYNDMITQAGRIQDLLQSHGNSDEYREFDLLYNYREFGYKTIGDIFAETFNKYKGEGLNIRDVYDLTIEEIQKRLGKRP